MSHQPVKPFLKWAGGKHKIAFQIAACLPKGRCLIEPFVGGGSVFLSTDYPRYILNDINPDLINLYKYIQSDVAGFIRASKRYFNDKYNNEVSYYRLRERFNKSEDVGERSVLFLYFNRAGYNGLVRYSMTPDGKAKFNVPFGRYAALKLPEQDIYAFAERCQLATFTCQDFRKCIKAARRGWTVYADPPYIPITQTSSFTDYHSGGFGMQDQLDLALLASESRHRGVTTLVSNHDTPIARRLYREAKLSFLDVRRNISANASKRGKVAELLALFERAD